MNPTQRDANSFEPPLEQSVLSQIPTRTTIAQQIPTGKRFQSKNVEFFVRLHTSLTFSAPFIEPQRFNLDEFEYERLGNDPGRIVIFNQEIFEKDVLGPSKITGTLKPRIGSRQDVIAIINCFQRMGFNIRANDVLSNGTVQDILEKLDEGR